MSPLRSRRASRELSSYYREYGIEQTYTHLEVAGDRERRPLEEARVLVVGGAGFVGSNLVRVMLDHAVGEVIVVDNFLSSERGEPAARTAVSG